MGYTEGNQCNLCDYIEGHIEIPATGHVAGIPATCDTEEACPVCGTVLEPALGHNFSSEYTIDIEADCQTEGMKSRHCLNDGCDTVTDRVTVPMAEHNLINNILSNSNCFVAGEREYVCQNEGCDYTYIETIETLSHSLDSKGCCQSAVLVSTYEELTAAIEAGRCIKLTDDIDAAAHTASFESYNAVLFGDNHRISNLRVPLFEYVNGGTVRDLRITGSVISSSYSDITNFEGRAGKGRAFIAGWANNGAIFSGITIDGSCMITAAGSNTTDVDIGSIVGILRGSGIIENCTSYAEIESTITSKVYIGGIAGALISDNAGTSNLLIRNCANYGKIDHKTEGANDSKVAGVVSAVQNGTVSACANYADVSSAETTGQAGGVLGWPNYDVAVEYCINAGIVTGGGVHGGIVAYSNGTGTCNVRTFTDCADYSGMANGSICANAKGKGTFTRCYSTSSNSIQGTFTNITLTNCNTYASLEAMFDAFEANIATKDIFKLSADGEDMFLSAIHSDHIFTEYVPAKAPTCTKVGYSEGLACEICGAYNDREMIPALGHTPDGSANLCTQNRLCTTCGEIVENMHSHNFVNGICTYCSVDYLVIMQHSEYTEFDYQPNTQTALTSEEISSSDVVILPDALYYNIEAGKFLETKFKINQNLGNVMVMICTTPGVFSTESKINNHKNMNLYAVGDGSYSGTGYFTVSFNYEGTYYINIGVGGKCYASIPVNVTKTTHTNKYVLCVKGDWDVLGADAYNYRTRITEMFYERYPWLHERWGKSANTRCEYVLFMDKSYTGVASCQVGNSGYTQVRYSASYAKKNPTQFGSLIHELTHGATNYSGGGWWGENIAEYGRFRYYQVVGNAKLSNKKYTISSSSDWGYADYGNCELFFAYMDDKYPTIVNADGTKTLGLIDQINYDMQYGIIKKISPTTAYASIRNITEEFDTIDEIRLQFVSEMNSQTWTFTGYALFRDNEVISEEKTGVPEPEYATGFTLPK